MIAIETYNGFLDLMPNTADEFYITRQVNDLFNLNTRNSDYAKTIKIPNSQGNRDRLEIQSNETKPPDRVKCSLFISDLSFSVNSELLINRIDKYFIEIIILINGSIFFTLIPEQSIKELDLVDYNFTWDLTGVQTIKNTTEGAIFGQSIFFDMPDVREAQIIGGSPGTDFDTFADLWVYGFSFYIKTIVKKIIENAGFTLDESQVSDIENYANTVVMCPVLGLVDQDLEATITALVDMESPPQVVTGTTAHVDFVANTDPGGLWNNTNDEYDIGATEAYNIILNYDITVSIHPLLIVSGVELRIKNDTTILETLKITESGDYAGTLQINEILDNTTTLYIEAFAATTVGADNILTLNSECDFAISSTQALFSRDLKVSDHLPLISQRNIITNFLALSNIILDIDDPSKSVVLKPFDSIFYKNPSDLTRNYDKSRGVEFSYIPNNYYKNSSIEYSNYSALQRNDAIFEVEIDNENLEIKGSIINFIFEGSDKERLYSRDLTYSPVFRGQLSNETGLNTTAGASTFTITGTAPDFKAGDFIDITIDTVRIATKTSANAGTIIGTWSNNHTNANWDLMKFSRSEPGPRVGWVDQDTAIVLSTSDGDMTSGGGSVAIADVRDVYFSDNLKPEEIYNTYYKNILDCFNKFVSVKCWFMLDALTFKTLEFTRSIYLEEFASRFYVNKLEQWRPNGLVRAELIRINKENG